MNYEQAFKRAKRRQIIWILIYCPIVVVMYVLSVEFGAIYHDVYVWLILLVAVLTFFSMRYSIKKIAEGVKCDSCGCNIYNNYLSCKNDGIKLNFCPSCGLKL